jgi:hypothetical protein
VGRRLEVSGRKAVGPRRCGAQRRLLRWTRPSNRRPPSSEHRSSRDRAAPRPASTRRSWASRLARDRRRRPAPCSGEARRTVSDRLQDQRWRWMRRSSSWIDPPSARTRTRSSQRRRRARVRYDTTKQLPPHSTRELGCSAWRDLYSADSMRHVSPHPRGATALPCEPAKQHLRNRHVMRESGKSIMV